MREKDLACCYKLNPFLNDCKYKKFISQKVLVDLCDYSYFSIHVNEGILSQS